MSDKKILAIVVIAIVLIGISATAIGTYNDQIGKRNATIKALEDVEAQYQRRLDTIPKFVQVAKFSVEFQLKLAIEHAKAREGIKQAAATGDPETLQRVANEGATVLLIAVRQEAVPEAKTDQLTELNAQIDSVERTISHARMAYNDAVRQYNNAIQQIPGVWFAAGWGFGPMKGFEAEKGAEKAPDVKF